MTNWRILWDKHRIRASQAGGLFLFVIAHPRSRPLYLLGFLAGLTGEALRVWAAGHIRKGSALAREGPYAMVRNPLYLGSLVMACGFALMCTSARHWLSAAAIWAAIGATFRWLYAEKIALEESDLSSQFAEAFAAYRRQVPAMKPDLSRLSEAWASSAWRLDQALRNKEHKTVLAFLFLAAVLRFKMIYRL